MKLHDLVETISWRELQPAIKEHFPHSELLRFEHAYLQLRNMSFLPSPMTIHISKLPEPCAFELDDPVYDVYATDGTTWNNGMNRLEHFAIEFRRWEEWLGMDVSQEVLDRFTPMSILAICIDEMTAAGNTQEDIKAEFEEIKRRVEEVKSGNAKTISFDELKARMHKKLSSSE